MAGSCDVRGSGVVSTVGTHRSWLVDVVGFVKGPGCVIGALAFAWPPVPALLAADPHPHCRLRTKGSKVVLLRGPMILTSNQSFAAWGEVFGDRVIATAILDRLLHHAVTLNIRGNSYRLKEKLKAGLVRAEEAEA